MRNYIILNNQRSDEISGLIVQELAPISKPLQRTQVETIDGRDGDIVTPLGYAAYDKKITIGLYGDFDINEIIAYFATQGTAIFSNEPDKYYNYQILDQIDYERLVRFRVATVTMHVQPFKYSATEGTLTVDSSDTVSGEGSNIVLDGTAEAPFTTLRHKGNAIQDGTPTPDNPIDVKVLTGDSKVRIYPTDQKNIADPQDFIDWINLSNELREKYNWQPSAPQAWSTYGVYDGRPHVVGFDSSLLYTVRDSMVDPTYNEFAQIYKGIFKENTRYTISFEFMKTVGTTGSTNLRVYYTDGTYSSPVIAGSAADWSRLEHTTIAGKTVKAISLTYASGHTWLDLDTLQIEEGIEASDYTPHISQNYVIPFGDTYLAGIGNYADEPVKVGDTWYIRRAIGKVVFDGSGDEGWWLQSGTTKQMRAPISGTFAGAPLMSDYFHNSSSESELGAMYIYLAGYIRAVSNQTSANDFKTWLSTHNTTVYYALATPTDEEITDQDLIDALDEFYSQAHSYKGHTHITATAADGNAPAILSVEVGEDNESTVTNAGNTTSRPILTIYGQGDIGVYINDVQVLDIALGNEQYITLDSTEMDAYKDSPANLKNRLVTGDYSKLALNAGANKIRFTGTVTKYEISKYSRWL